MVALIYNNMADGLNDHCPIKDLIEDLEIKYKNCVKTMSSQIK